MAVNDILPLDEAQFGQIGAKRWLVKNNTSTQGTGGSYVPAFRSGEPVRKTLGTGTTNNSAQTLATIGTGSSSYPVVGTDYLVGIAVGGQPVALGKGAGTSEAGGGVSTETDTLNGYVDVVQLVPNVVYLGNADVPATYGYNTTTGVVTQSTYDALVGSRVLIKQSASTTNPVFTILASDSANNGLVVEALDISKYPGKVAFSLRNALAYNS